MEKLSTPISIIVAGVIIAGAVVYTNGNYRSPSKNGGGAQTNTVQEAPKVALDPITKEDHLFGNPNASIIVIEYSDTECPFCKRFHGTLKQVMEKYGGDGQVAWVFRHFPIDSLHPKARTEHMALECAQELGGDEGFWSYLDILFETTPSNNGLDLALLPQMAADIGLDETAFNECVSSGRHAERIQKDVDSGIKLGVRGTPSGWILKKNGDSIPITGGAQPFHVVDALIQANL